LYDTGALCAQVEISTGTVSTLPTSISSSNTAIIYSATRNVLFYGNLNRIRQYNLTTNTITDVAGSVTGHLDGKYVNSTC
jgi:hypothetical protein